MAIKYRRVVLYLAVWAFVLTGAAAADEIELVSGKRYQGRLVQRTTESVTFKIMYPGGGWLVTDFPARNVRSVDVTGKDPVFAGGPAPSTRPRPATPTAPRTAPEAAPRPKPPASTPARIEALIQKAGTTPPDWWDSVALDYPETLDLTGKNRVQGWHPNKNLGAYLMSVVHPNPSRWKPTVKLLHRVVKIRKDDPSGLRQATLLLGASYQRMLKDWPRAAFWWKKAIAVGDRPSLASVIGLAECYFRLGSKPMAVNLLRTYGVDRMVHGAAIKLWADLGERGRALQLAEALARARPDEGYLAAGNVYRAAGDYDRAVAAFEKVLSAPNRQGNQRNRRRAQSAMEAIKLYEALDLTGVADGTYTGSGTGFRGEVEVAIEVKSGRIVSMKVTRHKEDRPLTALTDVPQQIVEKQGLRRIDAVTGATITAEAVLHAAAKALAKGVK